MLGNNYQLLLLKIESVTTAVIKLITVLKKLFSSIRVVPEFL